MFTRNLNSERVRMPASHLSQVHHRDDLAEAALNHVHDCACMMIPPVQHVDIFPHLRIAMSLRKISRRQSAKQNQIEIAVHLNILEPSISYGHMTVMAAAPHMYCGRDFGLLWEDVSKQHDPFQRSCQRSSLIKQET